MKRVLQVVAQPEDLQKPKRLFDPAFVYKKGSDVQQLWRKYGWTPPTEYRNDFNFKRNREDK